MTRLRERHAADGRAAAPADIDSPSSAREVFGEIDKRRGGNTVDIGFIGLGKMGFPMARRLVAAGHRLVVCDQRKVAVDGLVALGAKSAASPKEVADQAETVLASLPSLQASLEVATGPDGVIEGKRVKRFVDLSTVGSQMAVKIHDLLAAKNIVQLDSPVSGGVGGAEKGTLAVMVSGPAADFAAIKSALDVIGKVFFIGEKPGSAQTMKLANNFLSATAMVATSEAVVMGVKAGLDPNVMIDVINAGSGMNTASRDKFPRSVLPRSFDFGFATGLMVKDVRLCLDEMKSLGLSMEVAEAVGRLWEVVIRDMGAESDFTSAIKPIEKAAGVVVGGPRSHAAK
jgi:3-hydroxyisobutyrate dehydrogenase-like beta-hydroxyacid dehydrogenase